MAPAPKSKIIVLKLSKKSLVKFPSDSVAAADPSSPSSSAVDGNAQPVTGAGTPNPSAGVGSNGNAASPSDASKANGTPQKPSLKRNASQLTIDGVPKPRGKPGPKKKMRVDGVNGTLVPVNAPKLNPKASAGAINANLRALDRTGKPCRRWSRTPFAVKSFTGALWTAGSWGAPTRPPPVVDENGNTISEGKSNDSATPSDTPAKLKGDSSAIASERSNNGETNTPLVAPQINGVSPAPVAVV